jgi:3-methyladenine DNA glycosylase AlkD
MNVDNIITWLKEIADPTRLEHMKKYGINTDHALGISIYDLRLIAREIPKNHNLALQLWKTGIHEARMLACFIDEPKKITSDQMNKWAESFNSWDICD